MLCCVVLCCVALYIWIFMCIQKTRVTYGTKLYLDAYVYVIVICRVLRRLPYHAVIPPRYTCLYTCAR